MLSQNPLTKIEFGICKSLFSQHTGFVLALVISSNGIKFTFFQSSFCLCVCVPLGGYFASSLFFALSKKNDKGRWRVVAGKRQTLVRDQKLKWGWNRALCLCVYVCTNETIFFSLSNMYGRLKSITRATTLTLFLCPISFCPFFLFTETEQCRQLTTVLICVTLNSWQLVEKEDWAPKVQSCFIHPNKQ